jgi:hypothetical protein
LPTPEGFSVTPNIGTEFTVGGEFVKSGSQSISNASVFGASVTGTTVFSTSDKKFNDVYDQPIQLGLQGNYGLTTHDEVSLGLRWLHAEGKSFDALDVTSSGTINGTPFGVGASFQGKMDNYNEYGIDVGGRHFFDTATPAFHPFLGAVVGANHSDSVGLSLSFNGTTIVNGLNFYGSGWTWDGGLEAGFRYDVAPAIALGLQTGIRYTGDLKQDSSDINSNTAGGLSSVNSGGSRWSIPLVAGLTAKF